MTKKFLAMSVFLLFLSSLFLYSFGIVTSLFLTFLAIYLVIIGFRENRGCECLWMFLLVAITLLPINIAIEFNCYYLISIFLGGRIGRIVGLFLLYCVLFSIEELIAGIIGRIIWESQETDGWNY